MKLTEEQKDGIRWWLGLGKKEKRGGCPFGDTKTDCEICEKLFSDYDPFCKGENLVCPCTVLGIDEVTKRAKEWVK